MRIAASPQQAHLVPGYRLDGRYELLFPFAQGGMATVWVARVTGKHGFEKLVAVKTILPHLASDEGFRTMFLDEARIASRVRHPNVADIDDLGEEEGTLYMVLEWISGDSWAKLYNAIARAGHDFPMDLLLRIAADACAGLHAAHELRDDVGGLLNVVHRDVSPQNILINTGGVTKVIDFGVAKALDRIAEETRTGLLKGKAAYSAPEQVRGKGVDRRADIWAIGTILYQFLAGELPYEGKNDLATLRNLTSGRRAKPLPPEVPPQVASVVMTALSPAMEERFPTALDMQRALEGAMSRPTTPADVAALMRTYLADRMEGQRKELQEALAEAAQRAGAAAPVGAGRAKARGRLGSHPELVPPPIVAQVLGTGTAQDPGAGRGSLPSISEAAGERKQGIAAPDTSDDAAPTRVRGGLSQLRAVHWVMLVAATLVPLGVWALVAFVAMQGPSSLRGGAKGAPARSAEVPAGSAR